MRILILFAVILLFVAIFFIFTTLFQPDGKQDARQKLRKIVDIAKDSNVPPIFEYGVVVYKAVAVKFREEQLFYTEITWNDKRIVWDVLNAKQLERVNDFCVQLVHLLGEKTDKQQINYFEEIPPINSSVLTQQTNFGRNKILKDIAKNDLNLIKSLREKTKYLQSSVVIKQALEQGEDTEQILDKLEQI